MAAGGSCSLNCTDGSKVPSVVGAVECGVDGEWSIKQLPLKCIATCSEDVIIKGTKMLKDGNNSTTAEDLAMGKDEILAKHCTPLRVEDRKLFEEGNLCSNNMRNYSKTPQTWSVHFPASLLTTVVR